MNLKSLKHVHFTGIKGVGLTSLALCAQDLGIKTSGSDLEEEFVTDAILKKRNIHWKIGFSPQNIPSPVYDQPSKSLLIYTAAHNGPKNPEVVAAKKKGIPTLSHAQAVGLFMQDKIGISICGVGGKTTTAAMVAHILTEANLKPSFAIGVGNIPSLGTPGRFSKKGKHFVVEGDEYFAAPGFDDTPKFLYQHPEIIGVTNVSFDHPDVYKSFAATKKAYLKFFQTLPDNGVLVACADNKVSLETAKKSPANLTTYGFHPQADFRLKRYHIAAGKALFTLSYQGMDQDYVLQVPGRFNALNAAAAIAIASHLGLNQKVCVESLKKFAGTMRRFENLGTNHGLTIVDDYAHHPSQIKATLKAAQDWFPDQRIIAVFQPHTYSRTKALFDDFAQSFGDSDEVIFLPIYASSREVADPTISSQKLAQETSKHHPKASFQPRANLLQYLKDSTGQGDVILTLGAGDIFLLSQKLLKHL